MFNFFTLASRARDHRPNLVFTEYHPWNSWFKDFSILRKTTSEYILDVTLRLRLPHCLVAPARYRFFFLSLGLGVFGWYCAGTNARWVGYNASVHGPGAYGWRRGLRREQRVRNVEASCFSPSIAIWFLPAHDEGFTSGQSDQNAADTLKSSVLIWRITPTVVNEALLGTLAGLKLLDDDSMRCADMTCPSVLRL
jgi:hypothetical protein